MTARKKAPAKPKETRGAKSLLERRPDIIKAVGAALQAGHYAVVACDIAGISQASYYAWLERGEAVLQQLAREDEPEKARADLPQKEQLYAEFAETIARASATAEATALQHIKNAMPDDPRHAEWFLERRYPSRWGRREQLDIKHSDTSDPLADAALTDKEIRAELDAILARVSGEGDAAGTGEAG